jgi:hypothetical protein
MKILRFSMTFARRDKFALSFLSKLRPGFLAEGKWLVWTVDANGRNYQEDSSEDLRQAQNVIIAFASQSSNFPLTNIVAARCRFFAEFYRFGHLQPVQWGPVKFAPSAPKLGSES